VYRFNVSNKLEVSITIHLFKGMVEEPTLVNSRAMENFINQGPVERLKLGAKRLEWPIKLRNIDGTYN